MNTTKHGLNEKELAKFLMADCKSTGDIENKLKKLDITVSRQTIGSVMKKCNLISSYYDANYNLSHFRIQKRE